MYQLRKLAGVAALGTLGLFGSVSSYAQSDLSIEPPKGRFIVQAGQSLQDAMLAAKVQETSARLRAEWLAQGHQPVAASASGLPTLLSGKLLFSRLQVGNPQSYPSTQFIFSTGSAGLSSVSFQFTGPNGTQTLGYQYAMGPYQTQGSISFVYPSSAPLWSQPGTWTLSSVVIYDRAGNTRTYGQQQLANLFSPTTFTMINTGPSDATLPTITSGHLVSTTVSLSGSPLPQLQANITASDSGSGLYTPLVFIQPPGQTYAYAEFAPLATPQSYGTIVAYNTFSIYDTPGIWTIVGYSVCDAASNCAGSQNPAKVQALFGTTTFTLTN